MLLKGWHVPAQVLLAIYFDFGFLSFFSHLRPEVRAAASDLAVRVDILSPGFFDGLVTIFEYILLL